MDILCKLKGKFWIFYILIFFLRQIQNVENLFFKKNCIKIVLFLNMKKPLICLTYGISSPIIVTIVSDNKGGV